MRQKKKKNQKQGGYRFSDKQNTDTRLKLRKKRHGNLTFWQGTKEVNWYIWLGLPENLVFLPGAAPYVSHRVLGAC